MRTKDNHVFHCRSPKNRIVTMHVLAETIAQGKKLLEDKGCSRVEHIGIDPSAPYDFDAAPLTKQPFDDSLPFMGDK